MSGGGGSGPRSFAACTRAAKSAATSVGTLATQMRCISATLALSADRRARSNADRFVIWPLVLDLVEAQA
jgi:hypothetical protein